METTLLAAIVTLGGSALAYLYRRVTKLEREKWQLMQVILENAEAMKEYAKMRRQDGPGST